MEGKLSKCDNNFNVIKYLFSSTYVPVTLLDMHDSSKDNRKKKSVPACGCSPGNTCHSINSYHEWDRLARS